jgi:hypothetical protein
MKYRKLRIVWSVWWGVACLMLVALWVRSYWCDDVIYYFRNHHVVGVESAWGNVLPFRIYEDGRAFRWHAYSASSSKMFLQQLNLSQYAGLSMPLRPFKLHNAVSHITVPVPHWFIASILAALAGTPWLWWRFSLRTLLIAMTVVAVVLGLIVAAIR